VDGLMTELTPGTVIAGYRIESVIGWGGMGVVYRANHLALDRAVALKVITPELADEEDFRRRFEHESRVAASLHHPHIVTIHDAREEEGFLMIVMHFVAGTDLRRVMKREGRVEPARAVAICSQVGSALDAAHRHELVHRDVKPANILLGNEYGSETAHLSDFGLGKLIFSESGLTSAGMLVGTLDYLAPELIQGQHIDGRCDVYSLGCVMYQALSGRVPYPTEDDVAKVWAHIESPAPSLTDTAPYIPARLDDILKHAMAKDPSNRYPTAGEFCGEAAEVVGTPAPAAGLATPSREHAPRLAHGPRSDTTAPWPEASSEAAGADGRPPPAEPPAPPSRPAGRGRGRRSRRSPVIAAGGVVAALALALGGLVALNSGSDGAPESGGAGEPSQSRPTPTGKQHTDAESSPTSGDEEAHREPRTAQRLPLGRPVPGRIATHAGPFLRRARRNVGLTLEELSQNMHLSNGQHPRVHGLDHLESGLPATLAMYLRLADVLGVSASRMLGSEVYSRPPAQAAIQAAHHVMAWRLRRGLSRAEFAEKVFRPDGHPYSERLVAGLERGRPAPLVAYLAIARVTGIKPKQLLGTRVV
jgi:serine/threonine protein kinase/transcriptional regulator with XRE-family HTH domain